MLNLAAAGSGPTIPAEVEDGDGRTWTIARAWPGADGSVTFEAASRLSPHVRGGRITDSGGPVLAPLGSDSRLPELAGVAATGTVVVHRPGRRAVVRTADGTRFVKVVRPGRAEGVLQASDRAGAFATGFRVAAVLDGTPGTVHCAALRGRTLHDLGADRTVGSSAWEGLWDEWATAWTAVIGASAGDSNPGRAHPAVAEVDVVRTWSGHAQRMQGSTALAAELEETAGRVTELLTSGVADSLVPSHRDLHDKQLLWHRGDGFGLLDLDTATHGEAALDLGNLSAHVLLRQRQGLWPAAKTRTARAAVLDVAARLDVSPERLHAYETAARFRISCVYAYRPRWAALAGRLRSELRQELIGEKTTGTAAGRTHNGGRE